MKSKKNDSAERLSLPPGLRQGRMILIPDEHDHLDTVQLAKLEQSFREWVGASPRADVRLSRRRTLIIFLLIRYTGAKLKEVQELNPFEDLDFERHAVRFRDAGGNEGPVAREVFLSESLAGEIQAALADPEFKGFLHNLMNAPTASRKISTGRSLSKGEASFKECKPPFGGFNVDPAFVRRKFYERAQACGFPKRLGGPEMIRKARAVELMRDNMPLPAVQVMLGHSTPNLTSSMVAFSEDEIRQVIKIFMERESNRKTSARNAFFGKIQNIQRGDIQSIVVLTTISGHSITTVITNDSLERLGLKKGRLITAEIKAPWVILQRAVQEPFCSAENRFKGVISRIKKGTISSEYTIRVSDGTDLCAIVALESGRSLSLKKGDEVWALFNCFAVVLHVD